MHTVTVRDPDGGEDKRRGDSQSPIESAIRVKGVCYLQLLGYIYSWKRKLKGKKISVAKMPSLGI